MHECGPEREKKGEFNNVTLTPPHADTTLGRASVYPKVL